MAERIKKEMVYLILHYNTSEDTRACVASVRETEAWAESAIVIVDNGSPDGSGETLKAEYADDPAVTVLLNGTNAGFSAGNNAGYRYIRERFDAAFLTVCNNDVVFPEKDYTEKVRRIHGETPFAVLGPDIWNPRLGIHQNPLGTKSPDERAVRRTIRLNRAADFCFPLFWAVAGKKDAEKRLGNRKDSVENPGDRMEDVPLMGACLILSREFMQVKETLFEPETFLYYEEYLLYNYCRRSGMKILYRPEIRVEHFEGKATDTLSGNGKDRYRRMVKHMLAAARIYLKDLQENAGGSQER